MFGLFRRKSRETTSQEGSTQKEYAPAPGTDIRYDPKLVDHLKDEHQQLLALYTEIKTLFENGDYSTVSKKLGEFSSGLQAHLLTENVRLYIYLNYMFTNDETNMELIRNFRREMDGIARVAMNFLKKYEAIGVDEDLANHFAKDFATIGEVLGKRIEKEETTLYPLYMASY